MAEWFGGRTGREDIRDLRTRETWGCGCKGRCFGVGDEGCCLERELDAGEGGCDGEGDGAGG
jgi:hypothetical protein